MVTHPNCMFEQHAVADQSNWNIYRKRWLVAYSCCSSVMKAWNLWHHCVQHPDCYIWSAIKKPTTKNKRKKCKNWYLDKLPFPVWCTLHTCKKPRYQSGTQNNHSARGFYSLLLLKLLCWLSKLGSQTSSHYSSLLCNP